MGLCFGVYVSQMSPLSYIGSGLGRREGLDIGFGGPSAAVSGDCGQAVLHIHTYIIV